MRSLAFQCMGLKESPPEGTPQMGLVHPKGKYAHPLVIIGGDFRRLSCCRHGKLALALGHRLENSWTQR
jgi:hypothetical protein